MEAFYTSSHTWQNGQLTSLEICVSSDTNLLYALQPIAGLTSGQAGYGVFRVGYVHANTDYLCEAYYNLTGNDVWVASCY